MSKIIFRVKHCFGVSARLEGGGLPVLLVPGPIAVGPGRGVVGGSTEVLQTVVPSVAQPQAVLLQFEPATRGWAVTIVGEGEGVAGRRDVDR